MTSTGSTGGPLQALTPLNLILVSLSLPDEPNTDPEPGPAADGGGFLGLDMQPSGQLNMQPFPDED